MFQTLTKVCKSCSQCLDQSILTMTRNALKSIRAKTVVEWAFLVSDKDVKVTHVGKSRQSSKTMLTLYKGGLNKVFTKNSRNILNLYIS